MRQAELKATKLKLTLPSGQPGRLELSGLAIDSAELVQLVDIEPPVVIELDGEAQCRLLADKLVAGLVGGGADKLHADLSKRPAPDDITAIRELQFEAAMAEARARVEKCDPEPTIVAIVRPAQLTLEDTSE